MKILTSLIAIFLLSNCTENSRAKSFGGTMTVELPPQTKLVTATWKETELWYLYRPMRQGETPETSVFQENSSFGMWEGTVKFIEK